jgi:hypothetical protein
MYIHMVGFLAHIVYVTCDRLPGSHHVVCYVARTLYVTCGMLRGTYLVRDMWYVTWPIPCT